MRGGSRFVKQEVIVTSSTAPGLVRYASRAILAMTYRRELSVAL